MSQPRHDRPALRRLACLGCILAGAASARWAQTPFPVPNAPGGGDLAALGAACRDDVAADAASTATGRAASRVAARVAARPAHADRVQTPSFSKKPGFSPDRDERAVARTGGRACASRCRSASTPCCGSPRTKTATSASRARSCKRPTSSTSWPANAGSPISPSAWAIWRHEGGIQDFDGRLLDSSYGSVLGGLEMRGKIDIRDAIFTRLDAERKVWQQKGELSRFTSEQLARRRVSTYVDLMAAYSAEAIARRSGDRSCTTCSNRRRTWRRSIRACRSRWPASSPSWAPSRFSRAGCAKARHGAAAKLVYLLDLDPSCELVARRAAHRRLPPRRSAAHHAKPSSSWRCGTVPASASSKASSASSKKPATSGSAPCT